MIDKSKLIIYCLYCKEILCFISFNVIYFNVLCIKQ